MCESFSHPTCAFYKIVYSGGRVPERACILGHSEGGRESQDWARLRSGLRRSIRASCTGARGRHLPPSRHVSRELGLEQVPHTRSGPPSIDPHPTPVHALKQVTGESLQGARPASRLTCRPVSGHWKPGCGLGASRALSDLHTGPQPWPCVCVLGV